jgi:hypothetical protein
MYSTASAVLPRLFFIADIANHAEKSQSDSLAAKMSKGEGAKKCFRGRVVLDSHVVLEVRAVLALACALLRALLGAPHVPGMLSMAAASLEEGEGDAVARRASVHVDWLIALLAASAHDPDGR